MEQLTTKQVAAVFGVTRAAVSYWIKAGILPHERVETPAGMYYLIPASAIKTFKRPKRGKRKLTKAERLQRFARKLELETEAA